MMPAADRDGAEPRRVLCVPSSEQAAARAQPNKLTLAICRESKSQDQAEDDSQYRVNLCAACQRDSKN
eukprot:739569-Hanusia_phi.AAC.3